MSGLPPEAGEDFGILRGNRGRSPDGPSRLPPFLWLNKIVYWRRVESLTAEVHALSQHRAGPRGTEMVGVNDRRTRPIPSWREPKKCTPRRQSGQTLFPTTHVASVRLVWLGISGCAHSPVL